MPTPASFELPYCPNCRHPLQKDRLGWICWNQIHRNIQHPVGISNVQSDADALLGLVPVADQRYANHEADLCEKYHAPGANHCDQCQSPRDRFLWACPICREELLDIRNVSPKAMVVTGPSNAGKTHYIVALHQWWTDHLDGLGLEVRNSMGYKTQREFNRQLDHVMEHQKKLDATTKGDMVSFSWVIRPSGNSTRPGMLCTLPDISGERLTDVKYLAANHHYHHAAGIILILDGDRIAVAQKLMKPGMKRQARDNIDVVDAMIRDFEMRVDRDITLEEMQDIPVAICINKVDNLQALSPDWDEVMVDYVPEHNGGFDADAVEARGRRIEELLSQPGTTGLVNRLKVFRRREFFAMATIGNEPEGEHLTFEPISVEDPFLWLIWQLKMFGG